MTTIINDKFLVDIIREYSLSDDCLVDIIKNLDKPKLRKIMMMAKIRDLFSCTCEECQSGLHHCNSSEEFSICEICYDEVGCCCKLKVYSYENFIDKKFIEMCENCGKLYCENCRIKENIIIKECEDTGENVYFCNDACLRKIKETRELLYKRFKE